MALASEAALRDRGNNARWTCRRRGGNSSRCEPVLAISSARRRPHRLERGQDGAAASASALLELECDHVDRGGEAPRAPPGPS